MLSRLAIRRIRGLLPTDKNSTSVNSSAGIKKRKRKKQARRIIVHKVSING